MCVTRTQLRTYFLAIDFPDTLSFCNRPKPFPTKMKRRMRPTSRNGVNRELKYKWLQQRHRSTQPHLLFASKDNDSVSEFRSEIDGTYFAKKCEQSTQIWSDPATQSSI